MKAFFLLCLALIGGFYLGRAQNPKHPIATIDTSLSVDKKAFVFVIYAYNQGDWIEKTLQSILEQDYDTYRIVLIDDGSRDDTLAKAEAILDTAPLQRRNHLILHEDQKRGYLPCLYQAMLSLKDQEIAIPMMATDKIAHAAVLKDLNYVFQNPNTWLCQTSTMQYPAYKTTTILHEAFYAALFKQIPEEKLAQYLETLQTLAKEKIVRLEKICFLIQDF